MAATYNPILSCRGAKRGASGTTVMKGAKYFEVGANEKFRKGRGSAPLPASCDRVGADPEITVYSESFNDWTEHIAVTIDETLVLNYDDKITGPMHLGPRVRAAGGGMVKVQPPDEDGQVSLYALKFAVIKTADTDTVATVLAALNGYG